MDWYASLPYYSDGKGHSQGDNKKYMKTCTECKKELGFNEAWYEVKKKIRCEDCLFNPLSQ